MAFGEQQTRRTPEPFRDAHEKRYSPRIAKSCGKIFFSKFLKKTRANARREDPLYIGRPVERATPKNNFFFFLLLACAGLWRFSGEARDVSAPPLGCPCLIGYHITPYITACYHILPYITIYCHILPYITTYYHLVPHITMYYHILPYITTCYHKLPYIAIHRHALT